MKKLKYILIIFVLLFSSKEILAQQDSIALQRKARKLLRQGNELYNKNQFTDASVAYQKSLGDNANYDKASYNLGNAFYQNKNFKEAVPQYELTAKTAKDKFTKAEAYHNIGNAMMEQKQYQPAVDAYKNALRNNPNDDETRYNLAVAQKLLEKEKQDNKDKKNDKNKDKNKDNKDKDKDNKDKKDQNKDKKDGDNKDKKDDQDKGDKNKDKKQDPKKDEKKDQQKPKPQQGKMSPQQIKQLLESLNNEEKKTQKKMNAKKAKGKKVKQEKDW
ncbi:tetratricopeptide repeat protein [Polaribacter sp. Q13]|uniref:tetratricopeptide repeat protein n=1 Tax=Polaribacter sp. Q13 TaxID=2806551 RepID=UPI00193C3CB6|nr:tetratricopeptide repeat protein [Polaribacter sp. Q13]QVY64432.1 tetratricopeptide repeat protein [Polaribacter sp. Q13]